jgi:hypothetical protein
MLMVALPSTGVAWEAAYGYNPLGIRKGIITNILMRDYHGSLTNLADPLVGLNTDGVFTPYALDGGYRTDLLLPSFPGGQWYDLGALKDDGVKLASNTDVEETMIAQSRRPQRYDLTKEGDELTFTCREDNPTVDLLRFDMPLINIQDVGKQSYALRKPAEGDLVERQAIALAEDGDHRFAYIFPRVARSKIEDTAINKKDPHDFGVTYGALLCPYALYPVAIAREGIGWRAQGGAPVFPAPAPVATAVAGATATLSFTVPMLLHDPKPDVFTYVVKKTAMPAGTPTTTATQVGSPTLVGTTVTITLSGITAAAQWKFSVEATATVNSQMTTSSDSNTITGLA